MYKASKSFGLRHFLVLTVLATLILTATGCGSGHSGGCGAYGNPKAPSTNSETVAE